MGKLHKFTYYLLGLLCASAVTFQALAADSTARVQTSVDSSGYRGMTGRTFRTPPGVNVQPNPSFTRSVQKYGNGLQQSMGGYVSIDGVKGSHPISANVRATDSTLKGGAKSLLKGGLAGIALTAGLEQLFNAVDWVMTDGAQPRPGVGELLDGSINPYGVPPDSPGVSTRSRGNSNIETPTAPFLKVANYPNLSRPYFLYCYKSLDDFKLVGYTEPSCVYLPVAEPQLPETTINPVSDSAIDVAVEQYYSPEPDDWPLLSPHFQPDDVEIYELPGVILGEPETVTVTDAAGNPVSTTVTEPAFELVPRNNPSAQPDLDLHRNAVTKSYNEHGQLTDVKTTSTTGVASGGGDEPPTDCAFMPTVCAFIDWFKEPDPESNYEPDYSAIRDDIEPGDPDFQVGASTAGCPPPIKISFSMFPSTEVSLQPLCDFVDLLRPLVLMLAFFASASIVLRS